LEGHETNRMKTKHLHETLQQLHEELASTESVDPQSEKLLRELLADISALLATSGTASTDDGHTGYAARLTDASKRFENDHPGLVAAIGRVADALSRSGV
jgi:hypothetical protein